MSELVLFTSVAAVLAITPGADTALVTRNLLARGHVAAFATLGGIALGCSVHALASSLGLSAILLQSAELYRIVQLTGAAYLAWIGLQSLFAWWRGVEPPVSSARRVHTGRSFSEGWITNIANPKVALFYLTFLPQFIHPGEPPVRKALLLAAIHILLGVVWLGLYILVLGRMRQAMLRSGIRSKLEAVTGVLLVGLGIRMALDRR